MTERNILLVGEEFPTCPECGVRLAVSDKPVDADKDGDIYAGHCVTHGIWLLQDAPEDEDEDEDENEDEDEE